MSGPIITAPMVLGLRGPGLTSGDSSALASAVTSATTQATAAQTARTGAEAARTATQALIDGLGVTTTAPRGAHAWWRISITTSGSTGDHVAELLLRATPGGANQASGGTASASNAQTGYEAAKAFDGIPASVWAAAADPLWLAYNFAAPVSVNEISLTLDQSQPLTVAPVAWDVQYSDNGTTWVTAWSVAAQTWTTIGETRVFTDPQYGSERLVITPPADGQLYALRGNGMPSSWEPVSGGSSGSARRQRLLASFANGTYTVVSGSGLPTVTLSAANAGSSISGSTLVDANDAAFRTLYATSSVSSAPGGHYKTYATSTYSSGGATGASGASEITVYDGAVMEWVVAGHGTYVQALVDGRPAAEPVFVPSDGNFYWLKVNCGSAATRTHQLISDGTMFYRGATKESGRNFTADASVRAVLGAMMDSWGEGPEVVRPLPSLMTRAGLRVGLDMRASACGGTGFKATNSSVSGSLTYRGRLADLTGIANLDVGGFWMSQNDAVYTAAALQTEMILTLEAYRTALPTTPALIIGPSPPITLANTQPMSTSGQLSTTIYFEHRDVGAALADRYGFGFIDRIGWIQGDGNGTSPAGGSAATTGNGSSDIYIRADRAHLTPVPGVDYYSSRMADALRRFVVEKVQ